MWCNKIRKVKSTKHWSIQWYHTISWFIISEGNPGNLVQLSDDLRMGYVNDLDENESEDDEDTEWSLGDDSHRLE